MVAFRIRPRVPRPARGHLALFGATGAQATTGFCTLANPTGSLHAIGRQATTGHVIAGGALGAIGQQATTAKVTPALLCRGRQATTGRAGAGGLVAWGRQGTRSLVTPAILCFGKQVTRGQCAVQGGVAGQYVLSPDYTVRWAKHQAVSSDASVAQFAAGLGAKLVGGSAVQDDTDGLALIARRRTAGDWDCTFTTKRTDGTAPNVPSGNPLSEEALFFLFGLTGVGANPADVSAWAATTNGFSHTYRDGCTGGRINFYYQTDAAPAVARVAILGVFKGDGTATNVVGTTVFPNVQNTTYTWTLQRRGDSVSISATDGASTWADTLTSPAAAPLSTYADAGNVGLVVTPQRQVEVGDLTVTDNIVSVGNFANGYRYRALVEIAPQPDLSGTVANLVFRLTADVLAATALKTTGNGGQVQSPSGFDIRLEPYGAAVGAGKLDHQFVTPYSPTAGAVDLRFRVVVPGATPAWDVTTPYRLWLYVGKAGLVATEENPGGLWLGAMRATRLDTGADLSGGARALTPSGVTAGLTLAGMPAGRFAAASYCRREAPIYAEGLAAVTDEIVFQLDAAPGATDQGNLQRIGGTVGGTARYSSWIDGGGRINAGANWWDGANQHNGSVQTAAGTVDATLTHCMAVRRSGFDAIIYKNGVALPATVINAATSGTIHVQAGDNESVGAGTGAQNTSLPGLYALDVQWPAALSAAFVAMRYRSEVECRSVAGMGGGFDAFGDTDQGPVAVPWRTTNDGTQTLYNVVPKAFDPDGDPITLTAVGLSTHAGDVTALSGGQVQYKPQPGWTGGTAEVPFTIGDGRGKSGSSRLWLAVAPAIVVVGNEGLAPAFPASTATIKGPVAASAIQATYNALTASEIAGGVTILVTPGGTLSGGLTLNRSGAKGTGADDFHPQFPIIIRPGTLSGGLIVDPAIFPSVTITGTVTISGSYNWLRGCKVGWAVVGSQTNHPAGCRFNRCAATLTGNISDYGTSTSVDWCEIGNVAGVLLPRYAQLGCRTPFTYRTWLHDGVGTASGNGTMEMIGTGNLADAVACNGLQFECLLGPPGDISEGWESKSTGNVQRRCAIVGSAAQSLRAIVRHGANCEIDTLYCGPNSYAGFRGGPHVFADSAEVASPPPYWGPFTGNCTYAEWQAFAAAGAQAGKYPRGENVAMHRIANPIIGGSPSGTPDHPPVGTALLSCTGTTTRHDGATVTTGTSTRPLPTKAARNWPVPTGAASDLIGPMGTYNAAD